MKHEFDEFANDYRAINDRALSLSGESSTFFAQYKADKLAQWFAEKVNTPLAMLDFGCGDGVMTAFVQKNFPNAQLCGVDPSSDSIATARQKFPTISFDVSQKTRLTYTDHFFDFIYAAGVFHHIPFDQHTAYLQELMRILKPRGTLLLFELNPRNPGTAYIFNHSPIDRNAHLMPPPYTRALLKPYGKITLKYYSFFPHLLRHLRPIEQYLTALPLGGLYACWVQKD